jgi:hypothetical protein
MYTTSLKHISQSQDVRKNTPEHDMIKGDIDKELEDLEERFETACNKPIVRSASENYKDILES